MRTEVIYSSSNDPKEAHQQINEKLEKLDINPNFLFLFLTAGTWKAYEDFNKLLESYFPQAKMLGCIVEGYIAEDEIWTRGVSILLAEFDGEVEVYWANEGSATETVEKLGDKIGTGWDSILLMFPAFYFPGRLSLLKGFVNDKRYYSSFNSKEDVEEKRKVLEKYSEILESDFVFPINKVLRIMAEKTGKETPIIGMNLMPLEASYNTPIILANYLDIGKGAAAICFNGQVNEIFNDIFPERGDSYEETFELIENYFPNTEKVDILKEGLSLGEIGGLKPVDFLKKKRCGFQDLSQDETLKRISRGNLQTATPYLIGFISKNTYGVTFLGLESFPLNIYPSLFDLNDFYNKAAFVGEIYRGGIKGFGEIFDKKKFTGLDLFILDQNIIMSYGEYVHRLLDVINNKSNVYFGIFSSFPSAYIPNPDKKFFSEVDDKICLNVTGTSALLEFE